MKGSYFDWSILSRRSLIDFFWIISNDIIDRTLSPTQIHKIIATHLKTYLPVRVNKKYDPQVEKSWIYVGGSYLSHLDQEQKKSISVDFVYNPQEKKLKLSRAKFLKISITFADVILHEVIHMRQHRRRGFEFLPDYESNSLIPEQRREQRYLGCTDEIDAYSFNIACELMDKFKKNQKNVIKYLERNIGKKDIRLGGYKSYLKAFDYNHNHDIIKRLKKRIVRYLPNAEAGKPYKNKDWINH